MQAPPPISSKNEATSYPMCWWYKSTAQGGTSTRPPNAKEAYVPITGLLWQPKAVLKVYFMNRIPGSEGWRMSSNNFVSTDNILEWANEWHKTNQNCVPKFEESRDKFDNHIRIEFEEGTGRSWSYIGREANNVAQGKPTMVLDLGAGNFHTKEEADAFKHYLVLHEFGHVLGLGHEHQSPLAPELDKDKVIDHLVGKCGMGKDAAKEKYEADYKMGPASRDSRTTRHDPHSIMQYPIPKECYKNPSEWQAHGCGDFDPSLTETDKKEIVAMYRGSQPRAAGPSGSQDLPTKQGHLTSTPHSNDRPSVIHSATPKTGEGMRKLETNEEQDSGISGSAFTFPDDEIDEASHVELSTHSSPRVGGLFHSGLKLLTEGVLAAKNEVASNPDIGEGSESIPIAVSDRDQHSVSDTHNPGADASAHLMIVGGSSEPLSSQKNPYFKKAAEGLMDLIEAGSAIAEKNKQFADLQSNFEKLKNEKEDVEFAYETMRQQKDGEIKELKYQLQKRDDDLDRYKNRVAAKEQEIKALKEKNQEESQLMKQKHEKEIKALKQNVKAAEKQKEKVETELAKKETEYKALELKNEREVHILEMQLQRIQSNMAIQNSQKDTELAQEREKLAKMELKFHHSESSAAIAAKDAQIKQLEKEMAGMKANDTHN